MYLALATFILASAVLVVLLIATRLHSRLRSPSTLPRGAALPAASPSSLHDSKTMHATSDASHTSDPPDSPTTPKASATRAYTADVAPIALDDGPAVRGPPAITTTAPPASTSTSDSAVATADALQRLMPPPPAPPPKSPKRTQAPVAAGGIPPVPPPQRMASLRAPTSSMMPPPANRTASLAPNPRAPPQRISSAAAPTSSTLPAPARPRAKVVLAPGHSPLDWAQLTATKPREYLAGVPSLQRVTPSQLAQMDGRRGKPAWSAFGGKVYNVGPYLPFHPGGQGELKRGAGKVADKLFEEVHPWVNVDNMLRGCMVGLLVGESEVSGASDLEDID